MTHSEIPPLAQVQAQPTASQIRFQEILLQLIEEGPYRRNRAPIWKSLNISSAALSQYISGSARPRMEILVDIAAFFDVSLDYLILGKRKAIDPSDESRSMIRHVDWAVSEMREKVGAQAWLTVRVAEAIAERIQREVQNAAAGGATQVGILDNATMSQLERNSIETIVVTRDLSFDLLVSAGEFAPGRFSEVVTRNIQSDPPRKYRFLLDRSPTCEFAVSQFRGVLRNDMGVSEEHLENCEFRFAEQRLLTGLTAYKVDLAAFRNEAPMLYYGVENFFTTSDHLVFVTSPNSQLGGDVLCDASEGRLTLNAFEDLWTASDSSSVPLQQKRRRPRP